METFTFSQRYVRMYILSCKHSYHPEKKKPRRVFLELPRSISAWSTHCHKMHVGKLSVRQEHDSIQRNWAQLFRWASQKYFLNFIWQHDSISRWCYLCIRSEHMGGQNKLSLGKFPKYTGNKKSCPDFWCIIQLQPDNGLGAFQQYVVNFGKTRT